MFCGSFSCATRGCLQAGLHFTSSSRHLPNAPYALMARMAELHPVALSPFARILSTAAFRSSCVGASVSQPFEAVLVPFQR